MEQRMRLLIPKIVVYCLFYVKIYMVSKNGNRNFRDCLFNSGVLGNTANRYYFVV
jgi:hypothetical protein